MGKPRDEPRLPESEKFARRDGDRAGGGARNGDKAGTGGGNRHRGDPSRDPPSPGAATHSWAMAPCEMTALSEK